MLFLVLVLAKFNIFTKTFFLSMLKIFLFVTHLVLCFFFSCTDIHKHHINVNFMEEVSQPPETIASMWEAFSLIQWWQHKKSMIAWRLLEMSQSEVKEERIKAIRTLVSLKHLQGHNNSHDKYL